MAPILTTIVTSATNTGMEKLALVGVYGPYLILPFAIMCIAVFDDQSGQVNVLGKVKLS